MTELIGYNERAELRRVVKGRFELLNTQLKQRKQEIEVIIRRRIEAEYAERIAPFREEGKRLIARVEKLAKEIDALIERARMEGISPHSGKSRYQDTLSLAVTPDRWEPTGLADRVHDEFTELAKEHGLAAINLRAQELDLLEQLSITALKSTEAKEFLGRIPTVDYLLPLPEYAPRFLNAPASEED